MKRIIKFLSLFIVFLALSSCNKNQISFEDDTGSFPVNGNVSNPIEGTNPDTSLTNPSDYVDPTIDISITTEASTTTDIEKTVEKVYDSVVSIQATSASSISSGTGVLFSEDEALGLSYIVTCFHVIEGAYDFDVILSNGNTYDALLVGGYSDLDLAVLSINRIDLCYASFYDNSDNLKLGSSVVCIGNPLGTLPGSVSAGIVSYVNRKVQVDSYTTMNLIQTDVAINSGNSGGGLFNTAGALIGIVNAKYSSEGIEGLGFAIPINDVIDTIEKLMATAKYDANNNVWSEGYVEGDYEFGFTISLGQYNQGSFMRPIYSTVLYISAVKNDLTYSGAGAFQLEDIIQSVAIDYNDENIPDTELKEISTVTDVMTYLLDSNLSIGDKVSFIVLRANAETIVEFSIVQFIYSI
ncbi:MAG: S1C family serine protease [Anaeroplasma sp.]